LIVGGKFSIQQPCKNQNGTIIHKAENTISLFISEDQHKSVLFIHSICL